MSLAKIQEPPDKSLILLVGPPGAGKSTFCYQVVLNGLSMERPVIFVTTEHGPSEVIDLLKERGVGEPPPGALSFVDAFGDTVGATYPERQDSISANCEDLNSISMAIAKLQERIAQRDVFLAFDSLTSPYLFNEKEVFRFMRLCLAKFASQGNSVLALVDEGCGKQEDLVAMMSIANGIIRMETTESLKIIDIVKHPKIAPTKIEAPITWNTLVRQQMVDTEILNRMMKMSCSGQPSRSEVGDFVNVFWRNLASWSGIFWDPKRFPTMAYELDKEHESTATESLMVGLPWYKKLLFKALMPKSLNKVEDMKKVTSQFLQMGEEFGIATVEYVAEASKKGEHYLRLHETSSCWGFENVGCRLAFHDCGEWAGALKAMDKEGQDWNVMETKCIGLGDPYCEFKAVPGEIAGHKHFLESVNGSVVAKIHNSLMTQLTGFLIYGRPLNERPKLGSGIHFHEMHHVTGIPAFFSQRYQMALRMGGAKIGKEVGKHLMNAGLKEDEVIKRVAEFMEYCKVGRITVGGAMIRIRENCENFGIRSGQPSCFFTTGFLNGIFSAVKNQHVREIKCIASGDPYCEWEIV